MNAPHLEAETAPRPGPPPFTDLRWHQRLNVLNVSLLIFLIAVAFSASGLRGSGREIDYFANFLRFAGYMWPPDFSVAGRTAIALVETAQIAVVATFFAILLSLPLAVTGAQNLSPRWLVFISRMIMNCIRTVPSLIWALLAVAVVGIGPIAGVVALCFYSIGYLGKFFSDALESVDIEVARSLRAMGASSFQAFQHGLWPNAKPLVWSYSLWMVEYNIRSATIIGYVGAGGIGSQLFIYQDLYQWEKFCTVLLFILVIVTSLDFLGAWIRKKITRRVHYTRT